MADAALRIEEVAALDALPPAAAALFGADAFATPAWYRSVTTAAVPPGSQPCFQLAWDGAGRQAGGELLAVLPMWRSPVGYAAMTTPYTALWSPLLRAGLAPPALTALGRALGRCWRPGATTRLDAFDPEAAWVAPMLRGLRRAGLAPLRFDHFGNWRVSTAGLGWDAYLAQRPGELRSAIRRRSRRLMQDGGTFAIVGGGAGLEPGITDYERMHAASWKQAEPHPRFVATLMREAAGAGTLRLGLLAYRGEPVAAQLWLVQAGWAGLQKLAHDEAHRALAPGTVLTALMIRHLLEEERVTALDFGRGDDAYKALWTGERLQRAGVVLAWPARLAGMVEIARHAVGTVRRNAHRTPQRR